MSDLQAGLLVIGIVVVAGVYLFNVLQERRYRRKSEEGFKQEHEDVLFSAKPSARTDAPRVEPQMRSVPAHEKSAAGDQDSEPSENAVTPAPDEREARESFGEIPDTIDPVIDFVAEIEAPAGVPGALLQGALSEIAKIGKPFHCIAFSDETLAWEEPGDPDVRYTEVRFGLQLADRTGPVERAQLDEFCTIIKDLAEQTGATAQYPAPEAALSAARQLDQFCAEVDVTIGINLVSRDGNPLSGTKIRALAEAAGFKLESDGIFYLRDESGRTLYTLENQEAPFSREAMKTLSTPGVTLLFEVARVADGLREFDRLLALARNFAAALGAALVDDNRVPLNDAGIDKIRQQLRTIYATMDASRIPLVSTRALRLFS